jgi:hypothetical protein
VNNDVTLSVAHNLANQAAKLGMTYNTKVCGRILVALDACPWRVCPLVQVGSLVLVVVAAAAAAAVAVAASSSHRGSRHAHPHAHAARCRPHHHQVADKKTTFKVNYLHSTKKVSGEVISALAPNKKATLAFNDKQVRAVVLVRWRGWLAAAGAAGCFGRCRAVTAVLSLLCCH